MIADMIGPRQSDYANRDYWIKMTQITMIE